MSLTFWLVVAAVIVVGTALAWWSSGRARTGGRLAGRTRVDHENRALGQHRPTGGNGPGPGSGL